MVGVALGDTGLHLLEVHHPGPCPGHRRQSECTGIFGLTREKDVNAELLAETTESESGHRIGVLEQRRERNC